jgi:hypothetical protein
MLAAGGCASDPPPRAAASAANDASYRPVNHQGRYSGQDSLRSALDTCYAISKAYDIPVECDVTDYKGYPTMLLSFSNVRAVENYLEVVAEKVALPFCDTLIEAGLDARLVLYVRDMRAASVYACETGKFSDWMRVAYR